MKYYNLAKQLIESHTTLIGIRNLTDGENAEIGSACRESYKWDFNNDCSTYYTTGETAEGTCATAIDINNVDFYKGASEDVDNVQELVNAIAAAVELNADYGDGQQVLIAGDEDVTLSYATDPGEIRLSNAVVMAVV